VTCAFQVERDDALIGIVRAKVERNQHGAEDLVLLTAVEAQLADERLLLLRQAPACEVAAEDLVTGARHARHRVEVPGLHVRRDAELPLLVEQVADLVGAARLHAMRVGVLLVVGAGALHVEAGDTHRLGERGEVLLTLRYAGAGLHLHLEAGLLVDVDADLVEVDAHVLRSVVDLVQVPAPMLPARGPERLGQVAERTGLLGCVHERHDDARVHGAVGAVVGEPVPVVDLPVGEALALLRGLPAVHVGEHGAHHLQALGELRRPEARGEERVDDRGRRDAEPLLYDLPVIVPGVMTDLGLRRVR